MFDGLYKKVIDKFTETEVIAVDSGYKTPWIMKRIIDSARIPAVPYKRPMTKKDFSENMSMFMMSITIV